MLKDLVIKNRSYRGYDSSVNISYDDLKSFVELTRYTASSVNLQPLRYHIACEPSEVEKIQSMTKWAARLAKLNLPYPGTCPTAFIVICIDTAIAHNPDVFQKDVGITAQTILLAAVEKGLGGCMIGNFDRAGVSELLKLADTIKPQLVLAIGKPAEKVIITDAGPDGDTGYYRDETGSIHYVPKRALEDLLI